MLFINDSVAGDKKIEESCNLRIKLVDTSLQFLKLNNANHLKLENHNFDVNFDILHTQRRRLKLNLQGALETIQFKNSNNLVNDQLDLNNYRFIKCLLLNTLVFMF